VNVVTGISYYGKDVNGVVDHNTIANITNHSANLNAGAQGYTYGIITGGGNITNNIIHDITTGNAYNSDGQYNPVSITGIVQMNESPINATGNIIHDISNTLPNYVGGVFGISLQNKGVNYSTNTVSGNLIYGLKTDATATTAKIRGIYYFKCPNVINNNIIALSAEYNASLNGIFEGTTMASAAYSLMMCNNTVYLSGQATSGAAGSFCSSLNSTTTTRTIKNNIFVNVCTNSGATGTHTAFLVKPTGTIDLDYNDYWVGTGSNKMANNGTTAYTTMGAWRSATSKDAKSVSVDPGFANAPGTLGTDFMTSSMSLVGTPVAGITTDFSNTIRNTSVPTMGALENPEIGKITAVNPVKTSEIKVIVNQAGIAVQLDGESTIELYNVNGILIDKCKTSGLYIHSLNHGMYVIRVNDQVTRFIK